MRTTGIKQARQAVKDYHADRCPPLEIYMALCRFGLFKGRNVTPEANAYLGRNIVLCNDGLVRTRHTFAPVV